MRSRWLGLAVFMLGCTRGGCSEPLQGSQREAYPLDAASREVESARACPQVELTTYAGTTLNFAPPLKVTPPFAERLARFERVSAELARAMLGRAPSKVRHAGAYLCRPIRQRSERWSEHALGNAIDVIGFDFPRMPRGDAGLAVLPAPLHKPFDVRVTKHWKAGARPEEQVRQAFLRRLATELEDAEVFRGMIGPADPAHRTHLHLDMGRWRYRRL